MGLSSHFEERLQMFVRRALLFLVALLATTCGSKQDSNSMSTPDGATPEGETWQAPKDGVTPDGNFDVVEITETRDSHQDPAFAISLKPRGGLIDDGAWLFYECSSKQVGSSLNDAACGGVAIKDLAFSVVTSQTSLQLTEGASSKEASVEGIITPGSPVKFGKINSGSSSRNGGVVVKLPVTNEQNVTAVVARKDGKASASASVKASPTSYLPTDGPPRELTPEEQQNLLRGVNLPPIRQLSKFDTSNLERGIASLTALEAQMAQLDSNDAQVTPTNPSQPPPSAPGGSSGQNPFNFDQNVQGTATCVYPGPAKPICQQAAEAVFAAKKNVELKKEEVEVAKSNLATQKEWVNELRSNLGRAKSLAKSINSQFINECGSSKYLELEECQEFKETQIILCGFFDGDSVKESSNEPYWVKKGQPCRGYQQLSRKAVDCPPSSPKFKPNPDMRAGRGLEFVSLISSKTGRTKNDYSSEKSMCLDTTGKSLQKPQIDYGYWALAVLENGAPCGKTIGKITKLAMNPGSPKAQCDVITQTAKDFGFLDATALKLGDGYCVNGPKTCYEYTKQCAKRVAEGTLKESFSGKSWCKEFLKNDYLGCLKWHPIKASVGVMVVLGEFTYAEWPKLTCTNPYGWYSREEICNSTSGYLVGSLKDANELIEKLEPQAQSEKKKYDDMRAEIKQLEADLKSAEQGLNDAYQAEKECLGFNEQVNATATVCEPCRVCNPNEVIGTDSCESGYPNFHKGTKTKKCNSQGTGFEWGPCQVCTPRASETISCTSSFGHGEGKQVKTCNADGTDFELGPCQICTPNESAGTETCPYGLFGVEGSRTKTCNSNGTSYDYGPCLLCKPNESAGTEICTKDNLSNGQQGSRTKTCNADGTGFEKGPCIICTPNESVETGSCSVTNGTGTKTKTCSSDGTSYNAEEICIATSCSSGFKLIDGACVESVCTLDVSALHNTLRSQGRYETLGNHLNNVYTNSRSSGVFWGNPVTQSGLTWNSGYPTIYGAQGTGSDGNYYVLWQESATNWGLVNNEPCRSQKIKFTFYKVNCENETLEDITSSAITGGSNTFYCDYPLNHSKYQCTACEGVVLPDYFGPPKIK